MEKVIYIREAFDVGAMFVVPLLIVGFVLYGLFRGVRVYEEFVEGAKEGFNTGVKIMPYLVAILFAIGMFRASGGLDLVTNWMRPVLSYIGFPPELVPMAIVRPLTCPSKLSVFSWNRTASPFTSTRSIMIPGCDSRDIQLPA